MTKPNLPAKKPIASAIAEFAGLQDWFEVFRGGEQTDSKGVTKTFTNADLDSIVANHNAADPAPLVVGHPKNNDPAFGWVAGLKRDGNVLLAKGKDVVKEFEDAVQARMYRKRSVSLVPHEKGGYQLRHIGFLGAAAPAVPGLKDIAFNADDKAIEFACDMQGSLRATAWGLGSVASVLRTLREKWIEKFGIADADALVPSFQIDNIQSQADSLQDDANDMDDDPNPSLNPNFNVKPTGVVHMQKLGEQTFTKAELDAAIAAEVAKATATTAGELAGLQKKNREAAFAAANAKAVAVIDKLIADGALLPADATGIKEYCESLLGDAGAETFEFTAADGKTKSSMSKHDFMLGFLGKIQGGAIKLGKQPGDAPVGGNGSSAKWDGHNVDAERLALDAKVREYSKQHNVSYEAALDIVISQ